MCKHGIKATQIKLAKPRSDGRTHAPIDPCISNIVQALNKAKILTIASCCGHNNRPGIITLEDGRELIISPDFKTSRKIDKLFPDIWGNKIGE